MKRAVWTLLLGLLACAWAPLVEAQTIYWKRDTIYAGPGGGAIATVTPPTADSTAPAAPTGLSAGTVTATSVALSWTSMTDGSGSGLAGFKVYRQKGTGGSVPVGTVGAGATSFTDQPLEPSTGYTYKLVAFDNAQNHSADSNSVSITTSAVSTDTTAPGAPPQLSGQVLGSTSVKLTWLAATDAGGSGVGGYRVKRAGADVSGWLAGTARTFTDNTAPQNSTFSYTVDAKDGQGNIGSASNSVTVTTPLDSTPPSVPGSPGASGLTSTSIRVTWTASTDTGGSGLSGYKVYRAGTLISGTNPVTGLTFDHTGLAASTSYTNYTVKAVDAAGNLSAATAAVNATTLPDTIAPTQPGNVTLQVDGPYVTLTWSASTDSGGSGLAGYKVYLVTSEGGNYPEFLVTETTDTIAGVDTTGWELMNYWGFRVYAVDGAGNLSTPGVVQ